MKKYAVKYLVFLLPFLVVVTVELFFLPIDFFTFRVWETLFVKRSLGVLHGPFYPNTILVKTEKGGDLAAHSNCAIKKENIMWVTDKYGYRKANMPIKRFPVIIVGDSNIAGAGLTQDSMLSEVMEKKLKIPVYPVAPRGMNDIFKHSLLRQHPPDIVILESVERYIFTINFKLPKNNNFRDLSVLEKIILAIQLNDLVQEVSIKFNGIAKSNMLNYFRSRINRLNDADNEEATGSQCPILFLQGAAANNNVPQEQIDAVANKIKKCSDFFTESGVRFIFLPVPNKENIYYKQVGTAKPLFLEKLIKKLEELNIEVVDTQKAFDEITENSNTMLYHRDDTHWNAEGVRVAAELLEKLIKEKSKKLAQKK